jgi:nitrate reductase cytochrome c-type subunit
LEGREIVVVVVVVVVVVLMMNAMVRREFENVLQETRREEENGMKTRKWKSIKKLQKNK